MSAVETPEGTVEALERVLSSLVSERRRLRTENADRAELEANRLAIVAIQMHLNRALGRAHASSSE
jgi:hypothetical protein